MKEKGRTRRQRRAREEMKENVGTEFMAEDGYAEE